MIKHARLLLVVLLFVCTDGVADSFSSSDELRHGEKDAPVISLLKELAEFGDLTAQFDLGMSYEFGKGVPQDYAKAAFWYRKSAEQGLARAQSHLAVLYGEGKTGSRDYVQAAYWYRKAAEQGDSKAQNNLGAMCYKGEGVPQDKVQALFWWLTAAVQGSRSAHRNLRMIKKELKPEQIAEAHRLTSEWWRNR